MREHPPHDSFDDFFDEELREEMAATVAEFEAGLGERLVAALSIVKRRGTPLRRVDTFGNSGVCRLLFADGTTVLGRSTARGSLGMVAVSMSRGSTVLLTDVSSDGPRVRAVLAWDGHHRVVVDVVGGDQPG